MLKNAEKYFWGKTNKLVIVKTLIIGTIILGIAMMYLINKGDTILGLKCLLAVIIFNIVGYFFVKCPSCKKNLLLKICNTLHNGENQLETLFYLISCPNCSYSPVEFDKEKYKYYNTLLETYRDKKYFEFLEETKKYIETYDKTFDKLQSDHFERAILLDINLKVKHIMRLKKTDGYNKQDIAQLKKIAISIYTINKK